MKIRSAIIAALLVSFALAQLAMGRNVNQYDEEARQAEREAKRQQKETQRVHHPVKNFAGGVKQATVDSTAGLIADTVEETKDEAPVLGTLEGARKGSEKLLDNAVKGVAKVATLGYGDVEHYEVAEPEKGTDEPTKIRIKIPGT